MNSLNAKQKMMFNFIKDTIDERGIAPSVREIGAAVGLKSTSSVQYNLNALENAGYIVRDANLKRTIRISSQDNARHIPLVGTVTAGKPILAVESIEDYIPIPSKSANRDLFALRVKGDSMINAAILDGDIVVALIDDEATVKRFYKENGHFRLQPENESYEPIIVDELTVLGKVEMVIRNYG